MIDRDIRNSRIKELVERARCERIELIEPLLMECIEALKPNVEILSISETKNMYYELQSTFPFTSWGRIDCDKIKDKLHVTEVPKIHKCIENKFGESIFTIFSLWGYTSNNTPVIKTDLANAIIHLDDINTVGGDQWLYCREYKFVIEFYHEGDIVIGFAM